MPYLDPKEAFGHLQERVLDGIKSHFPNGVMAGKTQSLYLDGLEVRDDLHADDIRGQHKAKTQGETWSVPVFASFTIKDNATGHVIDSRRIRVAEIPKTTKRYSYIVGGQEWQVDNQWQLKPGIYTRRRENGELETMFNVSGKRSFDLLFDPASKVFKMGYNKAELPIYPLLKATGVTDEQLQKSWGKEIYEANKNARGVDSVLEKFYKADKKVAPATKDDAAAHFFNAMAASKVRPDSTAVTLGKAFSNVTGEVLHLATNKMLSVQAGHPEDDRDSLVFKDLRTVGDFAHDKLTTYETRKAIQLKAMRKLPFAKDVRDVIKFDTFNRPFLDTFKENAAARTATQINPVEMISSSLQTTVMGSGGIKSNRSVSDETKFINPSHLGFLDPVSTPEGDHTGISLRLPIGIRREGKEAKIRLYNLKTGQVESVGPSQFVASTVVLPDQVKWENGKPVPMSDVVKVSSKDNEIREAKFKDAQYAMLHSSQLFNMTSNLIPFLGSTSGGRASMASRHIEQAISLVHREAPLVQVSTGVSSGGTHTFEKLLGSQTSHASPVEGTIAAVHKDAIVVKDSDGKKHEVQLYNNYPLNDTKGVLHSTPLVKVGDKVKKEQVVADTNYSKNGTLALGTNLRVGYVPFKGYNFEDGVVISESAAKKLTSVHLNKPSMPLDDTTILSKTRYQREHGGTYSKDQTQHIGDDGVIALGTKVKPGDPLVLAIKPFQIKDRVGLGAIRKSMSGAHDDRSLRWDGDAEGEVVGIHRGKDGITVHVKTVEPMDVGDKLCFDGETEVLTASGWKRVAEVSLVDQVCCLVNGSITYQTPTELHQYSTGGNMYRIVSPHVDVFVTAEHSLYIKLHGSTCFRLKAARDVAGRRARYSKRGTWFGEDPVDVCLSALPVKNADTLPETRMSVAAYMMLLGAFLSNGRIIFDAASGPYGISIVKATGPRFDELCAALRKYGFEFSEVTDGNNSAVRLYSKRLAAHFHQFDRVESRFIPDEVFSYSRQSLELLLQWLTWGDGHNVHRRYSAYTCVSERLADDIQRLCLHTGRAANVHKKMNAGWLEVQSKHYYCQALYEARTVKHKIGPQVNHGPASKRTQEECWVKDYDEPVYCVTVPGHVLYVRRNGKAIWSGNSGRYGNKGIVSRLVPDAEMPHTKDGKPIEVALNPSGVPGRMNVGQILEVAAGKIAEKTGKPYVVKNFEPGVDYHARIKKELKAHGLSDTEELFDPVTKQPLGPAMVGPQHMFKLVHQVDKKLSVRSGLNMGKFGAPEHYDQNLQPVGGGHTGGQSIGGLELYALLAHGAKATIREQQSYKSEGADPQTNPAKKWNSDHNRIWAAIQTGTPLPPPKPTFVFQKFQDYLKASGINIEKKGHTFALSPMTDAHIRDLAKKELPKPTELVLAKFDKNNDPKPKPGGLFDETLTGGHGGKKWTRIKLAEPVPNPVFESAICHTTGLTTTEFRAIVHGTKGVSAKGELTDTSSGVTGGAGIKRLLDKIDVKKELPKAEAVLKTAPDLKVDKALKKVKYLRALDKLGMTASEAYLLHNLPVIPPVMRPVSILPDGGLRFDGLNQLYSDFAKVNEKLQDPTLQKNLTDDGKKELRTEYYDGVRALMGVHIPYGDKEHKGLLQRIAGKEPKNGFFQDTLIKRRQDLTMRSTIIPEPALGLDEVGLPEHAALDLYRPFVVRKLKDMGAIKTELEGPALLAKKTPQVWKALDKAMEERPVLMKRDPALHKYSVQAFKPKRVAGNAIQIHPLVTGGMGADFDGNCFLGSTKVVLNITNIWDKELEGVLPMKFSSETTACLFTKEQDKIAEVRLDQVPYLPYTGRKDRNGADVFDLPPGVYVSSYCPITHLPVFAEVTGITIEERCAVASVKTRRGFEVTASTNESLCLYNHSTGAVEDAKPEGSVGRLTPIIRKLSVPPLLPSVGDFRLGWMCGAFASDGFLMGTSKVFGISKVSDEYRNTFASAVSSFEGFPVHCVTYRDVHDEDDSISGCSVKDHISNAPRARQFFQQFYASPMVPGRACLSKKLPDILPMLSEDALIGVLCGLLDGDGSLSISRAKAKPQVLAAVGTSSVFLKDSIKSLCALLGIRSSVTEVQPKAGRLQKNTYYLVSLSTNDLIRYVDKLHVLSDSAKQALAMLREFPPSKDDIDIVPVPVALMEVFTRAGSPCPTDPLFRTLTSTKSHKKSGFYVTRETAFRMLAFFSPALEKTFASWRTLVEARSTHWDVIEEVTPAGVETVYDLIVPATKVFAVNGGLVVWDTMSVFLPITREAIDEAHKMMPTKNLFSDATGKMMYQPTLESALGLYKLSRVGEDKGRSFKDVSQVLLAAQKEKVHINEVVTIGGKKTTAGRVLVSAALPEAMQEDMLHGLDRPLNSKGLNALLTRVGKEHSEAYGDVVNKLKDLGNDASFGVPALPRPTAVGHGMDFKNAGSTPVAVHDNSKSFFIPIGTHTLSLKDFETDKASRDPIVAKAHAQAKAIYADSKLSAGEKDRRAIEVYTKADAQIGELHKAKQVKDPSNLFVMHQAGVKPGWGQYKQMVLAPMIYLDSANREIPTPVTSSYSEGLDVGGYWTQMQGARRGTVMKVQEVREPGVMSKRLMQNMMNVLVTSHDCGTQKGITLETSEPDIHDRHLAQDFNHGSLHVPSGTLLTSDLVSKIRAVKPNGQVVVRSPMKCEEEKGICQKCTGFSSSGQYHPLGTNVGILSAHAIGERAVQLSMKVFHCMHEHSIVLVRRGDRVFHTTLGHLFSEAYPSSSDGKEDVKEVVGTEIWDRSGWARIKTVSRHIQEAGTTMVFTRTRSGYGVVSQDNHPHMLAVNFAACAKCGTYPKKNKDGTRYYCRKCGRKWVGAPAVGDDFLAIPPSELREKSHAAVVDTGPAPAPATPGPFVDGWLAGIYCAEGCLHVADSILTGFHIAQEAGGPIYKYIYECLVAQYGVERYGADANGYVIYGKERAKAVQNAFGRYSRNVGLPDGWSGYPIGWLQDFVSGVFDGDGTFMFQDDSAWATGRIDTTSLLMAQQVHWVLRKLGVSSRVTLTPWRKISLNQGYAVCFVVTERAKEVLARSIKLKKVPGKPAALAERFESVVDYVRPVTFGAPPYVYDVETETGTLFVNGFWTHNSGGIKGGGFGTVDSFGHLENLLMLPQKVAGQASLAMASGKIEKIEHTPTGVNVFVEGRKKPHHIGKDVHGSPLHTPLPNVSSSDWHPPKVGMMVKAGDYLSDPSRTILNPHDLYAATGSMEQVQNHLASEVHKLYKDEGIKRRNIETIVRTMGNLTEVLDPGDHPGALRGEYRSLLSVNKINAALLKEGKQPIDHKPTLKGIEVLPREALDDWMAKLQHNHIRDTLTDAAATGAISHIHGVHPIPAVAFGAEIGLSNKDSNALGKGHLKDVPDHLY